ncbi:hypothetical protein [Alishewanella tabrizica]|uniref:Glycosyltransferase n=1 Tax=Alishewanella tabrizica TaxID=671278 RepID=A0ABQ2WKR1_9ALTE|nr:hypothetical protein [Alishewanella tabrizica]GGW58751.1 hypothetical protein GCM10008111_13440 [Alishewanella tabrizica]
MKPLSIAFVANTKNPRLFRSDPAFIYRCENLALALHDAGHHVELLHISKLNCTKPYDIIVLHRPKQQLFLAWRLAWLKRRGCRIIADFDDLVFLPEFANVSPGVVNGVVSLAQTQKNFATHQKALRYCDAFTVSVNPLQEKLQHLMPHKPILCLPNAVHQSWYAVPEAPDRTAVKRLTYFPGTRSHDKDFATIQPVLEQLLHEEPDLQLHITGVLNATITCRNSQLVRHPKQPFAGYAHHVAKSWLNLAPLELTEFNQHKSALKTIEAAWFNAPTLATPIPDMQRLQNAGALLMHNSDNWYHTVKQLLDQQHYAQTSRQLRQRIEQQGTISEFARHFLEFTQTL